ncbi:MAG: helix-turn-helix domain-containing protein [Desulfomonilaceae bacterium]
MGRVTKACLHMSVEELQMRLNGTKDRRTGQKFLVILEALVDPRPAAEIALHTGVSVHSVHNWIAVYNRCGLEGILGPGTGGRRNAHMTREEESLFLRPFFERAATGEIASLAEIREALEKYVRNPLHHSVVYRSLDRNDWRRIRPRASHVQARREEQETFKKNSRTK